MKQQPEFQLQKQICAWIQLQFPTVLFLSDSIAACKLTIPQQMRNKSVQKPNFHCPDLIILAPRGIWSGLFLELKTKSPFKKNGELLKNEHLQNQQKTIDDLRYQGYYAEFSWGFEQTKQIIEDYFNNKL